MSSASSVGSETGSGIVSFAVHGATSGESGTKTGPGSGSLGKDYGGLDFKLIWDSKSGAPVTIQLVAPTTQEKAAWTSDISQVHMHPFASLSPAHSVSAMQVHS